MSKSKDHDAHSDVLGNALDRIPASFDRFQEAHFWIHGMETYYHLSSHFRWHFSVFLKALKEVPQLLQMELQNEPGFTAWFRDQRDLLNRDPLIAHLSRQRDIVVHRDMLIPNSRCSVGIAFNDPWWKIVAWIIAAIAAIVAVVAASKGHGTASVSVKCDYDEKTGGLTNCRTPDPEPTTGPSEVSIASVASAVATTAMAVGMSDEIDPWRQGQDATVVPSNETTTSEKLEVNFVPLDDLESGKPFRVQINWLYSRITDKGVYHASMKEIKTNTHLLGTKRLTVARRVPATQDKVLVRAVLTRTDGSAYTGRDLFVTLLVKPPTGQGGEFRTILTDPGALGEYSGYFALGHAIAELRERGEKYLGDWRLYIIAQDINLSPDGLAPDKAAQIIGGFPIAGPAVVTLRAETCPIPTPDALMEVY